MTRQRPVYEVTATREGEWWAIVADLGEREVASQARRLDQVEPMIREAISLVLDVDAHAFDIEVTPVLPGVSAEAREAIELRQRLADLQGRLGEIEPEAVSELREHLTVRDVAELFGITPSRVSQIERRRAG